MFVLSPFFFEQHSTFVHHLFQQCVRGLPLATRAMPARAVAMSAVPQNKSMREPLDEPLMTTDSVVEHAAYENFRVPDSPAYKALMNLQMYYTVCIVVCQTYIV